MRTSTLTRLLSAALVLVVGLGTATAQTSDQGRPSANAQPSNGVALPPADAPPKAAPPNAAPRGLGALTERATSHTEFTFDRSMLSMADQYIDNAPPEVRQAAAGIQSITVRNYRFADGPQYNDAAMDAIESGYRAAHWKHLVNKNSNADGSGMFTDLWMHFNGAEINHLAILIRSDRNISFVSVACWLRPLDLLHLSGHFGIPKMDPNAVMVPAPDGK